MTGLWHRTLRRIGRSVSLVQFIVVTFMLRDEILGRTRPQRRVTALIARLTGDGERYAEEWAAGFVHFNRQRLFVGSGGVQ
ncbi:hypothetical protein ABZ946_33400 [Streptomyces sp. NPDC046324]|uniref:hypothetical protein n=1 Tax=Streptomyces sp. NPDC046324 TaxID=3154915 RepID=UPI003409A7C1